MTGIKKNSIRYSSFTGFAIDFHSSVVIHVIRLFACHFLAKIGSFQPLPQIMKEERSINSTCIAITFDSPRMIWKMMAGIMTRIRPDAAIGVRMGLMRKREGNKRPLTASNSINMSQLKENTIPTHEECTRILLSVRDALEVLNGRRKLPIIISLSFGTI